MIKIQKWFATLSFLLIFTNALAAPTSPLPLLQDISNRLIFELKRNQATIRNKPEIVYNIVTRILIPHVDTLTMARTALGWEAWQSATPRQRQLFTRQFSTLVIRTYSSALAAYTNEQIRFYPIRGNIDSDHVQVDSVIIRDDGPPINVRYRLIRQGGTWKLYDFSVDGISMITSFRSQFASEFQQSGMNGVLRKLAQHNQANE